MAPTSNIGLAPTRTTLDNGVVVLAKEANATPAVTINVVIRAGSIADPPGAAGTSYLLSRVIDRGTASHSADELAEALDARAVALSIGVTRHALTVACACLTDDFEAVLSLVGEIVREPSIPEEELTTRRGEVITSIRQDEDNPAVRATETLMATLYPDDHPYGRSTKGSITVVESLTRDRLIAHHAARFAPSEVSVAVVGDVDAARATDVAGSVFGSWRAAAPPPIALPPVGRATERRRIVIPMMSKAQADVAYGFTALRRSDGGYYAAMLMNNALGQYSIGGRLGDSIRERQGMAYYVYSSLDANVLEGPLTVRAGVSPANVERAVASIDEELARVVRDGLTSKELQESRQYLIGSMPRTLETNAGIAAFLQSAEFFGLGLDYDVRLPQLLGGVTLDEANAAARKLLDPDVATIVIAGPYEDR